MSWFFIAITGHLLNSIAFIIDKTLLKTTFKRSATYASMVSLLSLGTVIIIPWVKEWPSPEILPSSIASGAVFVLALWAFFEALKRGEATRVIPLVGSLIPLITLLFTATIFGERLNWREGIGFLFLLVATWLLTGGASKKSLDRPTMLLAFGAAILFATSSVFGKAAFSSGNFLGVFAMSRFAAGAIGFLIALFAPGAWDELRTVFRPSKVSNKPVGWTILGQVSGSAGFILLYVALISGSAAIINALQAVQYAVVVLAAWFGGRKLRILLGEERTQAIVLRKSAAIVLVGIGLFLIA